MELKSEKSLQWILATAVVFGLILSLFYFKRVALLKAFLVVNCLALIGTILLQAGKGGGLAAIGGLADQTAFGTRTGTFLSNVTYFIAAAFIISSICLTKLSTTIVVKEDVVEEQAESPMLPPEHPPVGKAQEAMPPAAQPEKEASPALGWQESQATEGEVTPSEAQQPPAQ